MTERTKVGAIIGSKEEKSILEGLRRLEEKIDKYHEEARGWHRLIGQEHHELKKREGA